ncbi:MAG: HAMP domain-containing histidine kinase [Acetobacteraceae bacterium]|nr:HAMP domain-containing histidine kinase [Acetobacteraceae bacterium]
MASAIWTRWLIFQETNLLVNIFHDLNARHGSWATGLVVTIYAGCLTAFLADVASTSPLAFGVFYAPLVVTATFHEDKRAVWVLAAISCVMVVLGAVFPALNPDLEVLLLNRFLSIVAVLATAAFVRHGRSIQDRLAEETERAEAAEQIKTEVLTNLSQEIRTPLHSMIGVLELIAADGRSEHKAALGMVRTAGRRLVATVDNLVDLTQFEGEIMPAEPVDLGMLVRQTTESSRSDAVARQIEMRVTVPSAAATLVHANPWAVRRILENMIGDAITYTAPGGKVLVEVVSEGDQIAAEITDTGTRPPGALQLVSDPDVSRLMPSVMGLALSQRLARAMHARLMFSTSAGEQTTARLVLPAVAARVQASR